MATPDRQNQTFGSPSVASSPTPAPAQTTEQLLVATLAQLAASQTQMAEMLRQQGEYNKQALKIAPRRKKTLAEYLHERQKRGAGKFLPHLVYQNGREVNPSGLSQATIDTLDQLASGHYCDGLVDVVRISEGPGGINSRIHIMYNNKSTEDRMTFYMRFPTLTKMVLDIAAEMVVNKTAPVIETGRDAPQYEFPESI